MNAKWYVLIILLSLFYTKQTNAQYLSVRGHFEVDQQLGCHDLTVTITNINPGICTTPPCPISYKFEGRNSTETSNPIHTYTDVDTVMIYQFIQGPSGEREDSIQVIIVSPELPEVELLSCNNLELLVQIQDNYYDVYEIDYGDGSTPIQVNKNNLVPPHTYANNNTRNVVVTGLFTTATNRCGITTNVFTPTTEVQPAQIDSLIALEASLIKLNYQLPPNSVNKLEVSINNNLNFVLYQNLSQNTVIDTISNLNITQNTYCFRIATYDACSNFKSYSNEICSIDLHASAQNNQITTDWSTVNLGTSQTTNLFRDSSILQSFASPTIQYLDTTVVCKTTYCYQVEVDFSGAISRSLEACETAFSTTIPEIINNISSITNSDSIDWNWQAPINTTPSYYMVHQVNSTGAIIKSDSVGSASYKSSFGNAIKYIEVEAFDICDNVSPIGNIANNLLITAETNSSQDIELTWNNYLGWVDGIDFYAITIRDINDNLIDSISVGSSTSYTLPLNDQTEQSLVFTVWAIPITGGINHSRSNILLFERDPIISIPNSFTPNGDGLNDKFVVTGKFIQSFEMQVFNRWGEVLYYTTDLENGWDGTTNNKKLKTGNYAYWMRLKDLNDNEHIRTGSILILSN